MRLLDQSDAKLLVEGILKLDDPCTPERAAGELVSKLCGYGFLSREESERLCDDLSLSISSYLDHIH